MDDLFAIRERKPGLLKKCYCTVKDYCGLLPVTGGIAMTGVTYMTVYSLTLLQSMGSQNILSGGDPVEILYSLQPAWDAGSRRATEVAGEWARYGFFTGQFLVYTFKKRAEGLIKKVFGGGNDG